jgi:hypothetical protein
MARGSEEPTKIPMVFCANTSRKGPTYLNTALATSRPSRQRLTTAPERPFGWKTPAEALNDHLLSIQTGGVATTP